MGGFPSEKPLLITSLLLGSAPNETGIINCINKIHYTEVKGNFLTANPQLHGNALIPMGVGPYLCNL